jgi:hypothetical protein
MKRKVSKVRLQKIKENGPKKVVCRQVLHRVLWLLRSRTLEELVGGIRLVLAAAVDGEGGLPEVKGSLTTVLTARYTSLPRPLA